MSDWTDEKLKGLYMEINPTGGKPVRYDDVKRFLGAIEALLPLRVRFLASVARHAVDVIKGVHELFGKHGIEVSVTADSDPKAADYLVNAVLGGAIGAAGGAAAGASAWLAARYAGRFVPGIGPAIGVASLIGLLLGVAGGLAVTRIGLRVRFSPVDPEVLDLECVPQTA